MLYRNRVKKKLARFGITHSKTYKFNDNHKHINASKSRPELEPGQQGNYWQNWFNTFKETGDRMLFENKAMSILVWKSCYQIEKNRISGENSSSKNQLAHVIN